MAMFLKMFIRFKKVKSNEIRNFILVILFLSSFSLHAQRTHSKSKILWHGYTQLRLTTNFDNTSNFSMQRSKFWIQSSPDFNWHWGFKVQTTLSSNKNEQFFLQDVLVFYRFSQFKLKLGQFVPEYSLQRFQPDYVMPLTNRSTVVNTLIPNGTLGVRDLGAELGWQSPNHKIQSWIGLFNGYGIKDYRQNNSGFMVTNKTQFQITSHFKAGYSIMFREASLLKFKNVLPDSVAFSGDDFRYNLFTEFQTKTLQLQAEYLATFLDKSQANGYYILAAYTIDKNQFVASWNQYHDLISSTHDSSEIHLGYNYLFNKDSIKLMADNGFQIVNHTVRNYILTIQFQLFFK